MSNLTITNNDLGSLIHASGVFRPETLALIGAQTVPAGRILARDSVSGKLVNYVPGGAALKSTGNGPFNLANGQTIILDVNNVGPVTTTVAATAATITDTTAYPCADQTGLTMTITLTGGPYSGEVQTITFGTATTAALIASFINAQARGVKASVSGGQVLLTHDGCGSVMRIACGAGTGGLTWAAQVVGTGNVTDENAVTATEIKTMVELATAADLTVVGTAAVFKATTELDFQASTALAALGLSVEVITANENGIPKAVMPYELAGANGDNAIRALIGGEVELDRLSTADGSTITLVIQDLLRDYGIVPVTVQELGALDNQ